MGYRTPTLDQFKSQFFRDFPYAVPSYGATGTAVLSAGAVQSITLNSGGVLYNKTPLVQFAGGGANATGAAATVTLTNNSVSAFVVTAGGSGYVKPPLVTVVSQDGDDTDLKKVTDQDILNAQGIAPANINQGLFPSQESYTTCFNLLSAHYMVTNLLNSTQGVKSQYDWLTQQRAVGSVSSTFIIPKSVRDSPFFATLTATRYGAQYLSIIAPLLHGNVRIVAGDTTP